MTSPLRKSGYGNPAIPDTCARVQIRTGHATKATAVSDSDTASGPVQRRQPLDAPAEEADRYSRRMVGHLSLSGESVRHRCRLSTAEAASPSCWCPASRAAGNGWRPAVEALAARCRVITFSLADEPSAAWPARGDRVRRLRRADRPGARHAPPRSRRDLRRLVRRADCRRVSAAGIPNGSRGWCWCRRFRRRGRPMHARGSSCASRGCCCRCSCCRRCGCIARLPPRPRDGGRASPRRCGRGARARALSRPGPDGARGRRSPWAPPSTALARDPGADAGGDGRGRRSTAWCRPRSPRSTRASGRTRRP